MTGGDAFRFRVGSTVEIGDTDLGGVVYYGRYTAHIDRAVVAYRRHLGIPALGPDGHLFVVRSMRIDYLSGARFEDRLEIAVRTVHLGRTSHTVETLIARVAGDGPDRPVASASQTFVGVSAYDSPRPTRMPAATAEAIRAFEGAALAAADAPPRARRTAGDAR